MNPAVRQLLLGRNSRLSLSSYGPTNPLYIAHRGGCYLAPEETPEAYQVSLDGGIVANEQDVQLSSDGVAVLMHDTTVDRTTTSTGNVVDLTAADIQALNIDAGAVMGGGFSDALHPSLFADILSRYRGQMLFAPEAKASGTPSVVVAALQAAGIPRDQALVQGFTTTAPALAVQNGYQGLYLTTNTTAEISTVKATGIQWCGLDHASTTDADFQAWVAAGFKVTAYTVGRRYRRDQLLALGLCGFFTDDPIYLAQAKAPATRDSFAAQRWQPGMLPASAEYILTEAERGRFAAPDYWGWATSDANARFVLQGWACPILNQPNATDFSIRFSVKFAAIADATRWASVFIADASFGDRPFKNNGSDGSNGYHFLMRKSGSIEIYRKDNGADVALGNVATVAIADGEEVNYRITITPTQIAIYRLNSSDVAVYQNFKSDTTYRGGYFHMGHASVGALFRNIQITAN